MAEIVRRKENGPAPMAYTINEAAAALSCCRRTIYRLIALGQLKSSKVLRHQRIAATELERFLNE